MADDEICVTVFYGGNFSTVQSLKKCMYIGGQSNEYYFDPDRICYMNLINIFEEDFSIPTTSALRLFYKIPGIELYEAMGEITNDNEVMQMVEIAKMEDNLFIYIVEESAIPLRSDSRDCNGPVSQADEAYGNVNLEDDAEDVHHEVEEEDGVVDDDSDEDFKENIEFEDDEDIKVPIEENMANNGVDPDVGPDIVTKGPYVKEDYNTSVEEFMYDAAEPKSVEDFKENIEFEDDEDIKVPIEEENMANNGVDPDVGPDTVTKGPYVKEDYNTSVEEFMYDATEPKLNVGILFKDAKDIRLAIRQYAVQNAYKLKTIRNDPVRVTVKCDANGCTWRCHASRLKDGHTFKIKKVTGQHCCTASDASKHASANWISHWMLGVLKSDMHRTISSLQRTLYMEFGVKALSRKVWRAKEKAMEQLRGSDESSFTLVPRYCNAIVHYNPGSTAVYKTDEDEAFQRMFMSLSASKIGFASGCRHFLGIDVCHLKGKYKGILLAATALDGNNGLFPLAVAVVESECRESWTWFFDKLSLILGQHSNVLFLSDRKKGLIEAVGDVFQNASHHFCVRHMYANFKKKHSGKALTEPFWQAAQAYTIHDFEVAMTKIRSLSLKAHAWLSRIPAATWSRSHFDLHYKTDILSNKLSEAFNAWIGEAIAMPIVDLMDTIRQKVMVMIRKRHADALQMKDRLVPRVKKSLDELSRNTRSMGLMRSGEYEWEVTEVMHMVSTRCRVLLDKRTCSCRRWDLTGIPCKHAVACIISICENIDAYCDPYYYTDTLRETYKEAIHALPDKSQWPNVNLRPVHPPHCRRPPRSLKRNRRRDADEPSSSQSRRPNHCHRCRKTGHNKATCKAPLQGNPLLVE